MTPGLLTNSRGATQHKHAPSTVRTEWGDRTYMRVIQYVPNELRDERINIAIVLQSPSHGYAGVRVRPYMDSLLQAIWPAIDAEIVRHMVREIEERLRPLNKATRKGSQPLLMEAYDERSLPTYLDRFNQSYGSLRITEAKPIRVANGESFKEKLNQLFDLYVRIDDGKQRRQGITKEVIQFQVGKELDRRGTVYTQHKILKGEFFQNKFDLARHRIDRIDSLAHIISFDLKTIDPAITQSLRLLQSVDDLIEADPRLFEKYEFGVFLQAPIHYRQHRGAYDDALRAFRSKFRVFQNAGDEPGLRPATERFVDSLASEQGFTGAA